MNITGSEHWATKKTPDGDVRLFIWRKRAAAFDPKASKGTILWVHGSSVQSQPAFDLQIPGKPENSVMDWFARLGYDNWCFDCEGYGKSDKKRPINADIAEGADDIHEVVKKIGTKVLLYGSSSGALRAGLYAQRHPENVARLALDALVWTGIDSPTLADRRKKLPQYKASNRRPIDRAFVESMFTRDGHGEAVDPVVLDAFANAVLSMDNSMPTGTYVDMTEKLPVVDPEKIKVPTLVMRGQWDGIASFDDLIQFFTLLPNPDKQFAVMPGISHASFQQKNYALVYHILYSFFTQPEPVYRGS